MSNNMKRERKYRGKRLDGQGWAVGSYIEAELQNGIAHEIVPYKRGEPVVEVDPETVGEYTGLIGIFEDDIINVRFGPNNEPIPMQVLFENGSWCIKEYWDDTLHDLYSYEDEIECVIGNVHENSELLKTNMKDFIDYEADLAEGICPECGEELIHENGCVQCQRCGFSLCGA